MAPAKYFTREEKTPAIEIRPKHEQSKPLKATKEGQTESKIARNTAKKERKKNEKK
jgi:hypothetical protein